MEKDAARPRAGAKSATAFRTISEVSDELDVPQHVLRFWETKFPQVRPLKRGGGRRYYRPEDVTLLRKIQRLLYSEGYTIKGVQRLLKDQRQLGTDSEDAESLADGLLAPGGAGDDMADDDSSEADLPDEPTAVPQSAQSKPSQESPPPPASSPATPRPQGAVAAPSPSPAAPLTAAHPAAPQPAQAPPSAPLLAASGDMPTWLRRELTALRAELVDLKSVLRKAIR